MRLLTVVSFILFMESPRSASGLTSLVHTGSRVVQVTPVTHEQQQLQQQQHNSFLIHDKGHSRDMILRSPSIAGINLIENWSDKATKDLLRATKQVVEANPILRGRVSMKANQLWITTPDDSVEGDNNQDDFLRILPTPDNAPDFSKITGIQERLDVIQKQVIPLFHPTELTPLTSMQISRKLPLFGVSLIELPNSFAVYTITMSHAVGDGVTFFQLVKELSLYMSGLPVEHPIDWNCPKKVTHEFYPPSSTKRDAAVTYGPAMMAGALVNFPFLPFRKAEVLLLKKDRVNAQRHALRSAWNTTDISGNDIITAAVCQACQSSDLFFFTENARQKGSPTMPIMAGGNFIYEIPVSRQTAIQPQKLRKVIQSHGEYKPNALPVAPFVLGRVGRVTSLASIAESVMYADTTVVCTIPLASFIQQIPLDVAIIFRYDKQHWGVLHNFQQFNRKAKLISEILANDKSEAEAVVHE